MSADLGKAKFWTTFLIEHCECPFSETLRHHVAGAHFHDFCPCGCASFHIDVADRKVLQPLVQTDPAKTSGHFCFFTHQRELRDGRLLSLDAFCDEAGVLCGIDVDINANTEPVPPPDEAAALLGLV